MGPLLQLSMMPGLALTLSTDGLLFLIWKGMLRIFRFPTSSTTRDNRRMKGLGSCLGGNSQRSLPRFLWLCMDLGTKSVGVLVQPFFESTIPKVLQSPRSAFHILAWKHSLAYSISYLIRSIVLPVFTHNDGNVRIS